MLNLFLKNYIGKIVNTNVVLFLRTLFLFYVHGCFVSMYACIPHVCLGSQKMVLDPLELELKTVVRACGTGDKPASAEPSLQPLVFICGMATLADIEFFYLHNS